VACVIATAAVGVGVLVRLEQVSSDGSYEERDRPIAVSLTTTDPPPPTDRWVPPPPPATVPLPPPPTRAGEPGADPSDPCPTAAEVELATRMPAGTPPSRISPDDVTVNDVVVPTTSCWYPGQGSVHMASDPDGVALAAIVASHGTTRVGPQDVGGQPYVVVDEFERPATYDAERPVLVLFHHDGVLYGVTAKPPDSGRCGRDCVAGFVTVVRGRLGA
jgi:hypothetical protein